MTDDQARTVANVILGAAAVAAAVYVVRTPSLRRAAWRMAITALTGTIPAWFARELRDAWAETAPALSPSNPSEGHRAI